MLFSRIQWWKDTADEPGNSIFMQELRKFLEAYKRIDSLQEKQQGFSFWQQTFQRTGIYIFFIDEHHLASTGISIDPRIKFVRQFRDLFFLS